MLKLRHRSGIKFVLVALPVIAFLLLGIPTSHAALTFSGTSVTGDSATGIDTAGTLTIGGSSATGIVLGRTGIQTSLPGSVTVTGNATTTALSITSLAGAGGCLSVSASGLVTTSTCSGASGVTSLNNLTGLVVATGTANEITVASGTGQVVISTPQAIAVTSAPTFAGITLTGNATTTNLTIAGLGSSGSPCLTVSASGLVSTSTCGGAFTAGGDLTGSASSQTVAKIQGNAVTSTAPSVNQVLAWNGTSWVPTSVAGTGTVTTSSAITANNFPFWVTAGGGLSGTSTLTVTGTTLTQSSALNVGGNLNVTGTAAFASTTITGNATTTALSITGLATASGNPCLVVSATGAVSTSTCGTGGGGSPAGSTGNLQYNAGSGSFGGISGSNINGQGGIVLNGSGADSIPLTVNYTGSTIGNLFAGTYTATASQGQVQVFSPITNLDADDGGNTATFATWYAFNNVNLAGTSTVTHDIGVNQRIFDDSTSTAAAAVGTSGVFSGDYNKSGISTTTNAYFLWGNGENVSAGKVTNLVEAFLPAPNVTSPGTVQYGANAFLASPQSANAQLPNYYTLETGGSTMGLPCGTLNGLYGTSSLYLDQCNTGGTSDFTGPVMVSTAPDSASTAPMTNASPMVLTLDGAPTDATNSLTAEGLNVDMETEQTGNGTYGGLEGVDVTVDHESGNSTATQMTAYNATIKGGNATSSIVPNAYAFKAQFGGGVGDAFGNIYGLYLNNLKPSFGGGSVGSIYDVYAADASATSYFAGNTAIGTNSTSSALNVGSGGLSVSGTATTTNLTITALGSTGSPCLVVSATGAVSTSTCGTGGGIGGSGTANQIAEFNTSSSITGIAIGSNGTVLTSNGATSSFQAIPGITLNGLLTPNGNATYNMQGNQFTLQGFSGNGSQNLFTLLDASSDTSNGYAIGVSTTVMNPASFLANGNGLVIASTGLSTFNKGIVQSGGLVSLASTTIAGQATTTALSITGLAGATGCLSVSASGAVTTSTCSGGSLSGGQSNYVPLWTGAGTLGTSTLQAAATSLVTVGGLAVGTTTNQAAGNLLVTGNATTTNLSIASLAGTSGCLSVSASGAVATSSCSSSGGSVSTSSAITASDFPFWSSVSGGLSGTSSLYVASSNGYIGVNDTNPLHGLEIAGNSSATVLTATPTDIGILNTNSSTNNDYSGISFLTYDVNGSELLDSKIEGIATSHASGTVSGQLSFFTRNSGTNQDDFDILPAGNANFLGPINDSSTLTVSSSISAANIYEPFATSTATTSSTVINWSRSNKQWVLMNVATTAISFSNIQNGASYSLWIMQNATGSETVSWQSTGSGRIVWPGGTAPTLTTTANDMDEVSFQCFTPSTTSTLSCYGANGSGNWGQ